LGCLVQFLLKGFEPSLPPNFVTAVSAKSVSIA